MLKEGTMKDFFIILMQEQDEFFKVQKKIKKRILKLGKIAKASINKNCPKFIVGYCWYLFQKEIMQQAQKSQIQYLKESFAMTQKWIEEGNRDRLNLANLTQLFGTGTKQHDKIRNYSNSKVFYRYISKNALEVLLKNRKIQKPLSYLICLQKFTCRLANPSLVYKLQFK